MRRRSGRVAVVLVATAAALWGASPATAAQVTEDVRFTTSDGVSLLTRVGGEGSLAPRPVIVEFSPYGPGCCAQYAGPAYTYLQVHIRGTGGSDGRFDALGDQNGRDMIEVLRWACEQPWSDGRLALYGFSASAIAVYNTLHRTLPCVQTAVLMAGTDDLYRDLMYPGGIPNMIPALGVFAGISSPIIADGPARLERNPASALDAFEGMRRTGFAFLEHPTLDGWWQERTMRGDANELPVLVVTSFYDVEPRGPFRSFRRLRNRDSKLLVIGAHDGTPAGQEAVRAREQQRWFDRYLGGVLNGVEVEPPVRLWLSDGDREAWAGGRFVRIDGQRWPIPRTVWQPLALDAAPSGTARSAVDGTLTPGAAQAPPATHSYATVPSLPLATDGHTTALLAAAGGANGMAQAFPIFTDMTLAEPLGLSYTTKALARDVAVAGPANLELRLSSTAPETDIYAVLSDIGPDGAANPIGTARLRSSYPEIDPARTTYDRDGNVVEPYNRFDRKTATPIGQDRLYRVEFWPLGNRFRRGHRIRLHVVGPSGFHVPAGVAVNTVTVGGSPGSRLLLPVLPGSDLATALR